MFGCLYAIVVLKATKGPTKSKQTRTEYDGRLRYSGRATLNHLKTAQCFNISWPFVVMMHACSHSKKLVRTVCLYHTNSTGLPHCPTVVMMSTNDLLTGAVLVHHAYRCTCCRDASYHPQGLNLGSGSWPLFSSSHLPFLLVPISCNIYYTPHTGLNANWILNDIRKMGPS